MIRKLLLLCLLLTFACLPDCLEAQAPRTSSKFTGPMREPPDRDADAIHLRLDVAFDMDKKEVAATASHTFRILGDGVRWLKLDAVGIQVSKAVRGDGAALTYDSTSDSLRIDLGREHRRGEDVTFTLEYRCRPQRGVYFRAPDEAYPRTPTQVWTQGEANEARHWIPCFDHPVDKITSEVIITAPDGMTAISNGRLVGEPAAGAGKRRFHWSQEKPHATYLIAVVVGDFAEYRDEWNGVPLIAYVPRDRANDAERSFRHTKDMMGFFSEKTGVPYPWAKYGQACVHEFLFGGMENTSLTILTDRTLHDARAALDVESTGLVAHELAHQWFGDLVTCRDWSDIWLNESFATFFENLYREKLLGWDEGVYERMQQGEGYQAEDRGRYRRPIVTRRYREPDDVFDAHAYPKGGRVLSMLRYVLGDDRFFAGIRKYLETNAYRSVDTSDFRRAMEEVTGSSLQWFFDQWLFSGGHPEYKVSWEWDERAKMARVQVRQTQKVDELTPLFRMPVEIAVITSGGRAVHRVEVSKADETFSFPATERPRRIRFDVRDWILKDLEFPRSKEELLHQLQNDEEVVGRIEAARLLAKRREDDVRQALLARLTGDPFYGVRAEIAKALREQGGEGVRDGLMAAFAKESKAPVRREMVQALADHPGARTCEFLRSAIAGDQSYFVVGDALRALAKTDRRGVIADAYRALERDSHQEEIRIAAVDVIASLETLEGKEREDALDRLLQLRQKGKPAAVRNAAGRALAKLGRGVDRVYRALAESAEDPSLDIRLGAYDHLAELGDRRAIDVLRVQRGKESHRPFRNPLDAIDASIKRLEGVGDRDQILEELRRLRQGRDDLERRLKVLEEKGPPDRGGPRKVEL